MVKLSIQLSNLQHIWSVRFVQFFKDQLEKSHHVLGLQLAWLIGRHTKGTTGSDSRLMALLQEAVARGKEVTVVVELKARFDASP